MKQYWTAPEQWPGATFVCIGGGPSLTPAQVEACRDRADAAGSRVRVIVINDGYRLAPWADVLYFCDDKWWQWHHQKLGGWKGLIVRLAGGAHDFGDARIKVLKNYGRTGYSGRDEKIGKGDEGLCDLRDGVFHGKNSGYQAINLAVHLGARRILLLGYDMNARFGVGRRPQTHWFGDHPGGTDPSVFNDMLPHFRALPAPLARRGVAVINCTPGSALKVFPHQTLEQALPPRELEAA